MDSNQNNYVLVVGATGFLGQEICRQLVKLNKPVKALVRTTSDTTKVNALKEMGVVTVEGDIKDRASLDAALQDTSYVISTASSTLSRQEGDSIETVDNAGQLNVVNAAVAAQVKQFVFVSFNSMPTSFPLQDAKRTVEKRLIESGLTYTILQPTFFMEVWLSPAVGFNYPDGSATIYGDGKSKVSWISLRDVASFAVVAIDNDAAKNAVIELGGPDALTTLEVVDIFERQTGKEFQLQFVPKEALQAQVQAAQDSLSKSFGSLMLTLTEDNEIDSSSTSKTFSVNLLSIEDYVHQVAPAIKNEVAL